MITIKKYPNRRLYDTSESRYVNLDFLRQLVIDHKDFVVLDSKSGEDLTRSMLLQIIAESETNHQRSLLTNSLMKQLIRFYDGDMQPFIRKYLETSLAIFLEQQENLHGLFRNMMEKNPVSVFHKILEKSRENWTSSSRKKPKAKSDDEEKEEKDER